MVLVYRETAMDFTQLQGFFGSILSRDVFRQLLLNSDFRSPNLWINFALTLAFAFIVYFLARRIAHSPAIQNLRWPSFRALIEQLLPPIFMLIASMVAMTSSQILGFNTIWLRLMALVANWMLLTRAFIWLLQMALPAHNHWLTKITRTLNIILWAYFLFRLSGYDQNLINALESVQFAIGSHKFNLLTIILAILSLTFFAIMMIWFTRTVNHKVMSLTGLDMNLRIMLSKIATILITFLAVVIALPTLGIDLGVLSVLTGALGVGLGFGLQKIASNYVSGFIILADHSVRPGDRLVVDNFTGHVTKITSRFVVLRSSTGQEALIPNETFITSTVINESYSSKYVYQTLDIQVAYHTDVPKALGILKDAACLQERVDTADSPPVAFLTNFGENGIDLRLGFWVKDPENGYAGLFSAILITVWRRFNEENIEFPYPQREIRILNEEGKPTLVSLQKAAALVQEDTKTDENHLDEHNELR